MRHILIVNKMKIWWIYHKTLRKTFIQWLRDSSINSIQTIAVALPCFLFLLFQIAIKLIHILALSYQTKRVTAKKNQFAVVWMCSLIIWPSFLYPHNNSAIGQCQKTIWSKQCDVMWPGGPAASDQTAFITKHAK